MKRIGLFVILAAILSGCTSKATKATLDEYNQVFEKVLTLEKLISQADFQSLSGDEITEMNKIGKELYYDYNPMDLTPEQVYPVALR